MLQPARQKYRKMQKGRNKGIATTGNKVSFGEFGLKALERGRLTARQIEAARRAMTRCAGKTAKIWIRIFPDRPFTAKAAEVPMGKGKGDPQGFCFEVRPGRVLFEIDGVTEAVAREALRKAGTKLPVKTRVIARQYQTL